MLNLLLILHIVSSIFLIIFILLNQGKGSELSILNQNNDLLSSKESSAILNKLIIFCAIFAVIINFTIIIFNKNISGKSQTIVNLSKQETYYK